MINDHKYFHTIRFIYVFQKLFITLNKIVYTCWEALCLIYYIKYINGSSQSHSPLLDMAGMILSYKPIEPKNNEPLAQLR